ncbi:MAG: hypothetical protein JNJ82_17785 [Opitutaceae bacterium]|nr:hypothetical protein [Opitutaceae bacterium]
MPFSAKTVRILRRALLGLAGFATVVAAAWLVENVRGQRAWDATLKEYAGRGDPLDVLPVPPPIPVEQNFMQTPLLMRLVLARSNSPELTAFREKHPLYDLVQEQRHPWDEGKRLDLDALAEEVKAHFAEKRRQAPSESAESSAAQLLSWFSGDDSPLSELRMAALQRPESRLVQSETPVLGGLLNASTPNYALLRHFVSSTSIHASAALAQRQPDVAFPSVVAGLNLGRGLSDPSQTLLESMLATVLLRMTVQPLWEGLQARAWNDRHLQRFGDVLSTIDPMGSLAQAVRNERNNAMFLPRSALIPPEDRKTTMPGWFWFRLMPLGWWRQNQVSIVRMNDAPLRVIDNHDQSEFRKWLDALPDVTEPPSPYNLFANQMLTAYRRIIPNCARTTQALRLAATACALERHRLAHAEYPESLAALVPTFLRSVPRDVVTGEPLHYRRNADGTFTLYSVGLDGDDDGGVRPADPKVTDGDGDWVW